MTVIDEDQMQLDFSIFHNVVDGNISSSPAETYSILNPATLENNPEVPLSTIEDVDRAVIAAQKATKSWAEVPWDERVNAVMKLADALEAQAEEFAQMLMKETGKPILWARSEVNISVQWLRDLCGLSLPETIIEKTEDREVKVRYTPVGITVGIVPWNYPLMLACMKFAPALLTGNTFIWKPSPYTPYCSLKVAELGLRFFPPGVFQALSGNDLLGPWLTEHPGVNMISFTGSAHTGRKVMETCSKSLKRMTLELSGNDPAIVCADVDPITVATKIASIAFYTSGQICITTKRVYVHEAVYDAVLSAMTGFAQSVKLGLTKDNFMSPVSNEPQFKRLKDLLADIESSGLKVAAGSTKPLPKDGYFLAPTIIDNPPEDSRIVVEEQFGPVLPVMKWSDEADVIKRANSTEFGLGASVWTRDMAQAERLEKQLQAGNIWINTHAEIQPNTPFSGHKQSGFGIELGVEGMKSYCNVKSIYTRPA